MFLVSYNKIQLKLHYSNEWFEFGTKKVDTQKLLEAWKCWRCQTPWDATFRTDPPTRVTIYKIRDKFDADGTVANKKKSGRNKTSSAEEDEILVALTFVISPKKSTRGASLQLSIPRTSLMRLMRKLKLRPYRPRLLHGLLCCCWCYFRASLLFSYYFKKGSSISTNMFENEGIEN